VLHRTPNAVCIVATGPRCALWTQTSDPEVKCRKGTAQHWDLACRFDAHCRAPADGPQRCADRLGQKAVECPTEGGRKQLPPPGKQRRAVPPRPATPGLATIGHYKRIQPGHRGCVTPLRPQDVP
jgi:hypothetical protein